MNLNFQSQADIRAEIIRSLEEIKRAATPAEICAAIWFRCAIDGTRSTVTRTVLDEINRMASDGLLEEADYSGHRGAVYYQPDILTRMSIISD